MITAIGHAFWFLLAPIYTFAKLLLHWNPRVYSAHLHTICLHLSPSQVHFQLRHVNHTSQTSTAKWTRSFRNNPETNHAGRTYILVCRPLYRPPTNHPPRVLGVCTKAVLAGAVRRPFWGCMRESRSRPVPRRVQSVMYSNSSTECKVCYYVHGYAKWIVHHIAARRLPCTASYTRMCIYSCFELKVQFYWDYMISFI